jgi:outer membrane protein
MRLLLPVSIILSILLSSFALYKTFGTSDLVYVDVNKLVEGYHRTKTAKVEFDKKAADAKNNIDSLLTKWEAELKLFEKERAQYSPKELQLKQELLQNKQNQINSYQDAVQKQLQEEDKKITQSVINDINNYVKEYGQSHGYKIIFGASGGGNIMYGESAADLTDDVLVGLNNINNEK